MSAPARRTLARMLHTSAAPRAASKFVMPAMSPTMTEGGIAAWKKKEGDSFAAGDVLLEIVRPLSSHGYSGSSDYW